jgi:hypothetical protein
MLRTTGPSGASLKVGKSPAFMWYATSADRVLLIKRVKVRIDSVAAKLIDEACRKRVRPQLLPFLAMPNLS